jgi:hypothetical protein
VQLWEDSEIDISSQLWQLLRQEDPIEEPVEEPAIASAEDTPIPEAVVLPGVMPVSTVVRTSVERDGQLLDAVESRPKASGRRMDSEEDDMWEEVTTTTTTTTTVTTVSTTTKRPARKTHL